MCLLSRQTRAGLTEPPTTNIRTGATYHTGFARGRPSAPKETEHVPKTNLFFAAGVTARTVRGGIGFDLLGTRIGKPVDCFVFA